MYKSKLANYKFIKHILRSFSCIFISSAMISAGVSINTLAVPPRRRYELHMLRNRMSADPASPISKVRAYLDHKMGIRLIDGRVIKGKFIALDHMGIMILANGEEFKEGKLQRSGYTYNIPVNLIAGMEDYGVA